MIRVLMVDYWGSGNRYAFNLAEALTSHDLRLTLATLDGSGSLRADAYELRAMLPTFPPGSNPVRKLFRYFAGHRRLLREARAAADIIHIQYVRRELLDLPLFLAAKRRGFRLVYTAHNVLPHERKWYHRPLFNTLYRLCDQIIVTSHAAARQLQSEFGIGAERVTIIPIGYTGPTELPWPSREEARRSLGIPMDARLILNFGAMRPYKGIDILLQAVATLRPEFPNLSVLVAGPCWESNLLDRYTRMIRALDLDGKVTLRGEFIPDAEALECMAAADLVVLPYKAASGHSAVMMMAFFAGRPVVASRVGGLAEAMVDGQTGFLIAPDDADALAGALRKGLRDPRGLERMGRMARARLDEQFSWRTIAGQTYDVYRRVLDTIKGGN